MRRFLNSLLISLCALLLYIPLYAANTTADTLTDHYLKVLDSALYKRISDNENARKKDYLITYDDIPPNIFSTDFRNNGDYFWFKNGSDEEEAVRKTVIDAQGKTAGEPLYIVLASIYNRVAPAEITEPDWSRIKEEGKYSVDHHELDKNLNSLVIRDVRTRVILPDDISVIYVISFFSVDGSGKHTVSHHCTYHGKNSLLNNGFVLDVSDYVNNNNTQQQDAKTKRISFLQKVVTKVADNIGQFNKEYERISALFDKLPADCLGRKFFADYDIYCRDKLILKKLALLINEMDYDAYAAYMNSKKNDANSMDESVFRDFYESLNKFNEKYKKISDELKKTFSIRKIVAILQDLNKRDMTALKFPERFQAISFLNSLPELWDNSAWHFAQYGSLQELSTVRGSEDVMVSLITNTPANQQALLLDSLKGKDEKYTMLQEIFYKVDDEPVGKGNYSNLVQSLAGFAVANANDAQLNEVFEKTRIYTWKDGKLRNVLDDETGMVTITVQENAWMSSVRFQYVTYWYEPKFDKESGTSLALYRVFQFAQKQSDGTFKVFGDTDDYESHLYKTVPLKPYELIAIIPADDIDYKTGFTLKKEQITLVPAFFLDWYVHKSNNQKVKNGINITLAAVTAATGVGTILNGANWGIKTLGALEAIFSLTATAGNYDSFNTFMREQLGNTGFAIFKGVEFGVNLFFAGKGAAALGKGGYNTVKKLCGSLLNVMKDKPGLMSKLRLLYPGRFKQMTAALHIKDLDNPNLLSMAEQESNLARDVGMLPDNDIALDPIGGSTTQLSGVTLRESEDLWTAEKTALLDRGTPPGSGGAGTVVAMETRTSALTANQELLAHFKSMGLAPVEERLVTSANLAGHSVTSASGLQIARQATQTGTLKLMQNATGATKVLLLSLEDKTYVLYAQGLAKPLVQTYQSTQTTVQPQPQPTLEENKRCNLCPVEPLICKLSEKSTYSQRIPALERLCAQLPSNQLHPVCERLNKLWVHELNQFLDDVLHTSSSTACPNVKVYLADNVRSITPGLIEAWEIFLEAGRSCLSVSMPHLTKLETAMENSLLRNPPYSLTNANFVNIARACSKQGSQVADVDNELFMNLSEFANKKYAVANFAGMTTNLENSNAFYTVVGANWVLKYMQGHPNEFSTATNIRFEESTEFDEEGRRISDLILTKRTKTIYYEFKSYQTSSLPPHKFIEQFTKDLLHEELKELTQLKWVFDGNKTNKTAVRTSLQERLVAEKKQLAPKKTIDMFNSLAKDTKYGKDVTNVTQLVKYLKDSNAQWFNAIFRVSK